MKAFQPLSSPSNNILDPPCQQTCPETWLPSQTPQKHQQVQKTNWWAFWKGTTGGRSSSLMPPEFLFHSKRKFFWRKNGRLFALFVHCDKKIFLFSIGTEQILKWKKTLPTDPLDLVTTCQCLGASSLVQHSLCGTGAVVLAQKILWCWHRAIQLRNPRAAGSKAVELSPKAAPFPSAQAVADRWQGWQLWLYPTRGWFSLPSACHSPPAFLTNAHAYAIFLEPHSNQKATQARH